MNDETRKNVMSKKVYIRVSYSGEKNGSSSLILLRSHVIKLPMHD